MRKRNLNVLAYDIWTFNTVRLQKGGVNCRGRRWKKKKWFTTTKRKIYDYLNLLTKTEKVVPRTMFFDSEKTEKEKTIVTVVRRFMQPENSYANTRIASPPRWSDVYVRKTRMTNESFSILHILRCICVRVFLNNKFYFSFLILSVLKSKIDTSVKEYFFHLS